LWIIGQVVLVSLMSRREAQTVRRSSGIFLSTSRIVLASSLSAQACGVGIHLKSPVSVR